MSSSRRIPALSLCHYSLSSAPPAPGAAAACWFFYSLREEWEGRGGGRAAAAPRWDLGPRGDYPWGWSCVCAVPASPGPFRHGLTPGSQRTPGKASYLPTAPARPRSDCHLRRHRVPEPLLPRPGAPPAGITLGFSKVFSPCHGSSVWGKLSPTSRLGDGFGGRQRVKSE